MDGDRVDEDEGDEPTDSDRLRAAADQGDEIARWAVTVGTNMRPGRSRRSIVGQPRWRVRRVGSVRRRLIRLTIRLEALLWAAVGRPVEVSGAITTPSRTIRWEVAVADGWLVVRLPGLPGRFSELGEIPGQGTTQVSASDRYNRLFSVLALSDGPAPETVDDRLVTNDGVAIDTEVRLRRIRLRILGIVAASHPVDDLYEEPPAQVAGWHRVHALDSGDLWVGLFSTEEAG